MRVTLGYSPCPNDTFVFCGLIHGQIADAPVCEEVLADIETLNEMALREQLDATKISFHALAHLREEYCLLHSGGALGRGCGPLLVAREKLALEDLKHKRIAIPGRLTTAALLLRLFDPSIEQLAVMPFDQIVRRDRARPSRCGRHHPREPLHLCPTRASSDHRPRPVVGGKHRASDPPRRHPRTAQPRSRTHRPARPRARAERGVRLCPPRRRAGLHPPARPRDGRWRHAGAHRPVRQPAHARLRSGRRGRHIRPDRAGRAGRHRA